MNIPRLALLFGLFGSQALFGQWKTETYNLRGGWNGIYLHGDATHQTTSELFANYPNVIEVWRWNPNPDAAQFGSSAAAPTESSSEWTVWKRNDPEEQKLSAMIGQAAYLIRCTGPSSTVTQVRIAQRPRPPSSTWLVSGANFQGFPALASPPLMTSYFGSLPQALSGRVFKYIGGELGGTNPMQVSTTVERVDRNTAYWFEAQMVSSFTGPVEYELPGSSGLSFGRSGSLITVGVMNRTTTEISVTLSVETSEPAPVGQTPIAGPVPLKLRQFDATTNSYVEKALTGSLIVKVPASGRYDLQLVVDRSSMAGSNTSQFASFLRLRDSANLSDAFLPVTAQVASPSGLWIGDIKIDSVISTVPGSPGSSIPRAFPLRTIIHVDQNETARLLSQAFVGPLATPGQLVGVSLREGSIAADRKEEAIRLVSTTMPLDRAVMGAGSFAIGSSLEHIVTIPFDDPVNPFVHQYHPDHDNLSPRLEPLRAGVESYQLTRRCTFTFTATPPGGGNMAGWGTTIFGGTYTEIITGLNKQPLEVSGTFLLRRFSEIADINLD
jgi:hypothetical protein